jgi:hypothetical protein
MSLSGTTLSCLLSTSHKDGHPVTHQMLTES